MTFIENYHFNSSSLEYGVWKSNNRQFLPTKLFTARVPINNCHDICQASISDIVPLKAGDQLSIQTSFEGQQFAMFEDTASFICHKLR